MPHNASQQQRPTPTFKETFIAVGQDTLDKQREDRQLILSAAPLVTGLMVLGAIGYFLSPILTLIALILALIALWGKVVLTRQVSADINDMHIAQAAYKAGKQPVECLAFIQARSAQMLADNKVLSAYAKAHILELQQWAAAQEDSPASA